jgi:hypothetical protein
MRNVENKVPTLAVVELVRQGNGEVAADGAVPATLCRFSRRPEALRVIDPGRRSRGSQAARLDDASPASVVVLDA